MPKNNKNNKSDKPEDENKDGKRKGKSKFQETKDKAKKSRRKNVKVWLPAVISPKNNTGEYANYTQEPDEEPTMTEHEISYKDALLIVEIEKLARQGLMDKEIIAAIGISATTFYERIASEPYFAFALFRHRGVATNKVTNALYNNAIGFHYVEQQATAMGDVVFVQKYKQPDTKAALEWLYNRDKAHWKKKIEPVVDKGKSISHIGVTLKRRG